MRLKRDSLLIQLRKDDSNNVSAGSTYQPTYDTCYDSTYDPIWNSRREPHPGPNFPLQREYNPITYNSSNRASSQIALSGRSTGYRTSDTMTPHRDSSTGNQRREPNATYHSRDSRDDTRKDKDNDSPNSKKSSSPKEKGSGRHKYAKKDRNGKYDRDERYKYDEQYEDDEQHAHDEKYHRDERYDRDAKYDRGERYDRDRNPYR